MAILLGFAVACGGNKVEEQHNDAQESKTTNIPVHKSKPILPDHNSTNIDRSIESLNLNIDNDERVDFGEVISVQVVK